jgi:hypothetical protein
MYVKMRSRLSATISASQEKRKFVLEDVFWVPISNCSSRHSTSRFVTPFQMGAWVSFYEISRVRSRHVLSCDCSGIREAGRQVAARQARNKRTPGSAASVHYHRFRVPHRLASPILGD